MRIIIGNVAIHTVDAPSVSYAGTTSDPVPKARVSFVDDASNIAITPLSELLILDEQIIPNTTINLLLNPSLNPYTTNWTQTSGTGITLSQNGGGGVILTFSNASNGVAVHSQGQIVTYPVAAMQKYTLSATVQGSSSPTAIQAFIQINYLDAAGNYISSTSFFGPSPVSTSAALYQVTGTPPANAASLQVWLGGQATNATNSGVITFTNVQLEPQWFPDIILYPTPWCGPAQTNCTQLPQGFYIRQHRKFGGLVNHALARDYQGPQRTWDVDAVGYAWLFSSTLTANSFTNQYDSAIITSLLSTYFPAQGANTLFGTSGVVQGALISNLQSNWDDLRTIFDSLAANSGFFWTVDAYWQFIFQPPSYTQMTIALLVNQLTPAPDLVTTFPVYAWQAEMDFTQPGASILVLGGNTNTNLTAPLTNGVQVATISVVALAAPLISGQILSVAGRQGILLNSNIAAGATSINTGSPSFTPTADYAVGTPITTGQYVANIIDPVNETSYNNQAMLGYGLSGSMFMRKLDDSTLQSIGDASNRGLAELLQYDTPRFLYHGTTNVEPVVGQGVQVTSTVDGLNAQTLLIQQMTAQWLGTNQLGGDVWEYSFDLGPPNRSATSIISHIFRRTTKSTVAAPISNTALVVLERFTVTDTVPGSAPTLTAGVYGTATYGSTTQYS